MQKNAKPLKRNIREYKGILIGPSRAPHFLVIEIPSLFFRTVRDVGFGPKFSGTDGKSTKRSPKETRRPADTGGYLTTSLNFIRSDTLRLC
jgi:hypothetical protein